MAIRNIVKEGDELLRKKSKPVVDFDKNLHTLLDDMVETMHRAEGAGLAAVQVGVLKRVFVMHAGKEIRECINPKICFIRSFLWTSLFKDIHEIIVV